MKNREPVHFRCQSDAVGVAGWSCNLGRRTLFNIVSRNQDDHVKNIAFLMDRSGEWSLSPAYDVTYSYNSSGAWTSRHQMSVNGKRENFELDDLIEFGKSAGLKPTKAKKMIESISSIVSHWLEFADECGVNEKMAEKIAHTHRTSFVK